MTAWAILDSGSPFSVLVRKAPKKDELVITFFRKGRVFGVAYLTVKDHLKPFRGRLRTNAIDSYIQPKKLMEAVRKARQIVLVPDDATRSMGPGLEALFPWSSPIWARPCKFCLLRGEVRFPKKPVKYGLDRICIDCAKSQFTKEAQSKGWRSSDAMIKHLGRILERAGDYDTAWRTISPEFDPDRDSNLSLYDVIEEKKAEHPVVGIEDIVGRYRDPERARAFVEKLKDLGIKFLLPVQIFAVEKGLLEGRSLLVVSSTSSGKTLIAEMAGVPQALSGMKFLYLTPLVALANLRYSEFVHKYKGLGLTTAIKVGVGRIRVGRDLKLNTDVERADIIVGTYEGIEQMLRSGAGKRLGEIGVVAIDEIQNLADEDRGSRLDGLIKKLRVLYPDAQFLHLSATVGNPEELSGKLGTSLILYDERPVPLERHVIPVSSPGQKIRLMGRMIRREFESRSPEGYRGQTIIFTNSRRKCHQIASTLSAPSARMSPYHSGLSYERRRTVEFQFIRQSIAGVVTTAALAAGVDLPASQVIFETLAMGMEWISPGEFHQMLGRAGRLGFHGSGRAVLLIEPGRSFSRAERRTEDQVALDLLSSGVDPVVPAYTHENLVEQVLADISTFGALKANELDRLQDYGVGFSSSLRPIIEGILRRGMVLKKGSSYVVTPTGRITSSFFLSPEQSAFMVKSVKKGLPPRAIVVGSTQFERAYLSEKLQKQLERSSRRHTSVRFFDSEVLDLLSRPRRITSHWFREVVGRITSNLLRCRCKGSPHCDCPVRKLSERILDLRLSGSNPEEISKMIFSLYGIEAYPGDILEYLNDAVRSSEAVSRFSEVLKRPRLADRARNLTAKIVG